MTIYNYSCINYDSFICKMNQLFQLLDEKEGKINIRIGDHLNEFKIYLPYDGKYDLLVVNHNIFINWYKRSEKNHDLCDCSFSFYFHHRKRLFEWYEYVDDNIGDFPVMDHVLFRGKNLVYPDLFLKHIDLMVVELV